MKQGEKKFCDFRNFASVIKKEAFEMFLLTYENASEFIEKYRNDLLPCDIIQHQCQRYLTQENEIIISSGDYETALKIIYKELIEEVLNKLVDEGTLELCWNKKEKNFFWREVKENDSGRRHKKKSRRRF